MSEEMKNISAGERVALEAARALGLTDDVEVVADQNTTSARTQSAEDIALAGLAVATAGKEMNEELPVVQQVDGQTSVDELIEIYPDPDGFVMNKTSNNASDGSSIKDSNQKVQEKTSEKRGFFARLFGG